MTYIPSLGGRLKLGAGWCNTPSPVLRGAGNESLYDRDIVAPPGNQAATEKTNVCLTGDENPAYSPTLRYPHRSGRPSHSAGNRGHGRKSGPDHEIAGALATSPCPNRPSGRCTSHCSPCFRASRRLLLAVYCQPAATRSALSPASSSCQERSHPRGSADSSRSRARTRLRAP